jgi:transposase
MDGTTASAPDWRIPDELWEAIDWILPVHKNTHRFGGGRRRTPDRVCMDAIFFVLRTGCQWKALDATKFCPGSTAHDRFQEWVAAGVFFEMWKAGLLEYDCLAGIDWNWLSIDGSMTKAPLGGEKDREKPDRSRQGRRQAERIGRSLGRADRYRRRRREPQRHEVGSRNLREHSRGAARANA